MCRTGAAFEEELPQIGILPSRLSGEWLREIEQALQQEVKQLVTADQYQQACVFSELRTKYLYAPLDVERMSRERAAPKSEPPRAREAPRKSSAAQARELFEQGLAEASPTEGAGFRLPWAQLARLCGVACAAGLALVLAVPFFWNGDLEGYSGDELRRVSVHLARGSRNGDGKGSAFVGAMKDDFFMLDAGKQTLEAQRIVDRLRARGVREIMIYDGDKHLRIQALGSQTVRVLAARPS